MHGQCTRTIWTNFPSELTKRLNKIYEIWLQMAKGFQRKSCLKMLMMDDDGQRPFGSGELKTNYVWPRNWKSICIFFNWPKLVPDHFHLELLSQGIFSCTAVHCHHWIQIPAGKCQAMQKWLCSMLNCAKTVWSLNATWNIHTAAN